MAEHVQVTRCAVTPGVNIEYTIYLEIMPKYSVTILHNRSGNTRVWVGGATLQECCRHFRVNKSLYYFSRTTCLMVTVTLSGAQRGRYTHTWWETGT